MTWTLRFTDEGGVEIARVTADPFEYESTHPDGPAAWGSLTTHLAGFASGLEYGSIVEETEHGHLLTRTVESYNDTPENHLAWVEENVRAESRVESTTLADE